MKKIILALALLIISVDVSAWTGKTCSPNQLEEGKTILTDVSYTLEYASDFMDRFGNFQESHFKISFLNVPTGYSILLSTTGGDEVVLTGGEMATYVDSGVHSVQFYSDSCDTLIKSYEMMVPHYKTYCGKDVSCEDNIWFDGTFENSPSNENRLAKSKTSTLLIVVLVLLVAVIASFIIITIKRRKNREKDF